jgi:hypothetical protein
MVISIQYWVRWEKYILTRLFSVILPSLYSIDEFSHKPAPENMPVRLADVYAILLNGQLKQYNQPEDIFKATASAKIAAFLSSVRAWRKRRWINRDHKCGAGPGLFC